MSGTAILFKEVIDYALQFLKIREARSEKEKELQRQFVSAFRNALLLTRAYIADRRDGITGVDREKEVGLSQAWNSVGICGRELEPQGDFYAVYFEKANYWADPNGWEISECKDLDISLEKAETEAARFIKYDNNE